MTKANLELIERATEIRIEKENNAKTGVGSLVCGILSLLVPFGGFILGIIACCISCDTGMGKAGKVMGILGIIFNVIGTLCVIAFM